jgi:HEAT repeat protein
MAQDVPVLIAALNASEMRVRRSAAEALGKMGSALVPALIGALKDAEARVRINAAKALSWFGPGAVEAVPALISALGDPNGNVQWAVAEALAAIGPAAVSPLIAALGNADESVRRRAAQVLGTIGPAAVPALITALAGSNVRSNAAEALARMGPVAAEAVPALITALHDADESVRSSAAGALAAIGPTSVSPLIALLGDPDDNVRRSAAQALAQIKSGAVPALIVALGDVDKSVRANAAQVLGEIGTAPLLGGAAQRPPRAASEYERRVRRIAAEATLAQIGPAAADAVLTLIAALGDADKAVRTNASEALSKIVPAVLAAVQQSVEESAAMPRGTMYPAAPDAKPVDTAVFSPLRVAKDSVFLIQVFLYQIDAEDKVYEQARKVDPFAELRGTYSLPLDLPRNTRVDLRLEVPSLTVNEPDAVLIWRGRPTATQFEVTYQPQHRARRRSDASALPWRASPLAHCVSRSYSPRRGPSSSAQRCGKPKRCAIAGPLSPIPCKTSPKCLEGCRRSASRA